MSKSKRFTKKRENKNKKRDIERLRRQQQHQHHQQREMGGDSTTAQPLIPDHTAQLISGDGEGPVNNSTKQTESETMSNTYVSDGTYSSFLITLWIILLHDSYSKFAYWIFNLFNRQQFLRINYSPLLIDRSSVRIALSKWRK